MSSSKLFHGKSRPPAQNIVEEEEGLLSGVPDHSSKDEEPDTGHVWSRRKIIGTASVFIALLISGAFVRTLLRGPVSPSTHSLWFTGGGDLRSNGTHDFKRTVIIVSIDGLRYECTSLKAMPYHLIT